VQGHGDCYGSKHNGSSAEQKNSKQKETRMLDKRFVLDNNQGWIELHEQMGTEATITDRSSICYGNHGKGEVKPEVLKKLLDSGHTSPFEHVQFTFLIHCPLFVRGQWHRHRCWSYQEISRRFTSKDMEIYLPDTFRPEKGKEDISKSVARATKEWISRGHESALSLYIYLLNTGVCREQARGVLPQNMMVTFWGTVDLNNLLKFLALRTDEHAQWEIRQYAFAIQDMLKPRFPLLAEHKGW